MDPKAVPEARAPEYLRPGGGDLAMVQGWGSWARAPAGASGPVLSVPSSAPRAVPLSPARSVGPSSRGRVLPAPSRMQREFAPPNVGPGFSSPTRRLAGAGIPHLDWSLNFPGRTRFRGCHASAPTGPQRPPPILSPTSRPQRDCRFTCTRLGGGSGCSSRVRTEAPPGGSRRSYRRCCHRRCQPPRLPGAAAPRFVRSHRRRNPGRPRPCGSPQPPPTASPCPGPHAPAPGVGFSPGSPSCTALGIH
ncbi:proline-rich protein HaeIII subfamily 1-like [Globicephala melas]|uniref:proline-rich protein HaeIII subfamily 1-like n=1 Tax=Globicephala melas TaxID=9731 RepID=UPI00387305BB